MKKAIISLFVLVLSGCGPKGGSVNTAGAWVSQREYQNAYFGFRVAVPEEWELKKGTSDDINQRAVDFMAGDEKNLRSAMKSAIDKTQTLFWSYRYPVGTPGKSNPNVSMLIESVARFPGIKSSEDYLLAIEQTLKLSNKTFTMSPSRTVDLGGLHLAMRESEMPIGTLVVHQKFYATLKDRLILLIGVTTMADGDETEVAKIVQSIKAI